MIGKITKGKNFYGALRYILDPDKRPTVLDLAKHCLGDTLAELTEEFMMIAELRSTTRKPVRHFSLGFAPSDGEIDDDIKTAIAIRVMDEMGYADCQYIAVAHHRDDPGHTEIHRHDHLHIVANAVTLYGDRVSDFWDFPKLENCLRGIERDFRLERVKCSWERDRPDLSEDPIELQDKIVAAFGDNPTLKLGLERLAADEIDVKFTVTRTGYVKGISYIEAGKMYHGGDIGLSWRAVSKQITPSDDDARTIAIANQKAQAIAVEVTDEHQERFETAARLAAAILVDRSTFKNARIEIAQVDDKLMVKRLRPERTILTAQRDDAGEWVPVGAIDVTKVDLQHVVKAAHKLGITEPVSEREIVTVVPPVDPQAPPTIDRTITRRGYSR